MSENPLQQFIDGPNNRPKASWFDYETCTWRTDCPVDYLRPENLVRIGRLTFEVVDHYNEPGHHCSPRVNLYRETDNKLCWLSYQAIKSLADNGNLELVWWPGDDENEIAAERQLNQKAKAD